MIQVKTIEIRDSATFIPAMVVLVENEGTDDSYLIRRAGFMTSPGIYLIRLDSGEGQVDPYKWGPDARTMPAVHHLFYQDRSRFHSLSGGDVMDVEFILGETKAPKTSERFGDGGAL